MSDDKLISASELANMGYCERQVAFNAHYFKRTTDKQRMAQARGRRAHATFEAESLSIAARSQTKGKCFVATMALGRDCPETLALRRFRDLKLRRSAWGRWLIGAYYKGSPALCRWAEDKPWIVAMMRGPLRLLSRMATTLTHNE